MVRTIPQRQISSTEERIGASKKNIEIKKDTPQFGDVRTSQEEALRNTVGENITLQSNALVYYPDSDDMTLNGKINTLNLTFQFRYNDPCGAM
jgi:hypothetical protein